MMGEAWEYGHECHCIYLGLWPCVSLYLPGTMAMCVTVFTYFIYFLVLVQHMYHHG